MTKTIIRASVVIIVIHLAVYEVVPGSLHRNFSIVKGDIASFFFSLHSSSLSRKEKQTSELRKRDFSRSDIK